MRVARSPSAPTAEEIERHNATHLPHRSWCPICIKARGKEDARKKQETKGSKPTVPTGYTEFCEDKEGGDKTMMIVVKDEESKSLAAHKCEQKGAADNWIVERIKDDLRTWGHTELILKTDGEPALVQVQEAVGQTWSGKIIPQNPPAYDPQANGAVERGVQEVMGQLRALKIGLEARIGMLVPATWSIVQ